MKWLEWIAHVFLLLVAIGVGIYIWAPINSGIDRQTNKITHIIYQGHLSHEYDDGDNAGKLAGLKALHWTTSHLAWLPGFLILALIEVIFIRIFWSRVPTANDSAKPPIPKTVGVAMFLGRRLHVYLGEGVHLIPKPLFGLMMVAVSPVTKDFITRDVPVIKNVAQGKKQVIVIKEVETQVIWLVNLDEIMDYIDFLGAVRVEQVLGGLVDAVVRSMASDDQEWIGFLASKDSLNDKLRTSINEYIDTSTFQGQGGKPVKMGVDITSVLVLHIKADPDLLAKAQREITEAIDSRIYKEQQDSIINGTKKMVEETGANPDLAGMLIVANQEIPLNNMTAQIHHFSGLNEGGALLGVLGGVVNKLTGGLPAPTPGGTATTGGTTGTKSTTGGKRYPKRRP